MATVEQQIAVRIKNFVEGLPQVQALSAAVQGLSKVRSANGLKETAAQVVNLGNVSDKTVKDLATLFSGFSAGTTSVKTFTGELGVAAREMKAITDQSHLLPAAGSIQLPARNPVFQTLKPLTDSVPVIEQTTKSLRTEEETVSRIEGNARRLAEAWQEGNAALKKQIELLAASQGEQTNSAFKNFISGGKGGSAGTANVVSDVENAKKPVQNLNDNLDEVPKKVAKGSSAIEGFMRSLGRIIIISALFAAFYTVLNSIKDVIHTIVRGVEAFIQEGIRFNASLETSKISLASLIAQTSDIRDAQGNLVTGAEKFAAAEAIAGQEMAKIQAIAVETRFQFEDILQAITLATAAVGGTNVTISQTIGLVEKLARAAGAVKLNPSQFQTQVRQILTGATRIQTTLAVALFPGQSATDINKQIKSWREAGTLVDNLNKRLEVFSFTAKEVEGTFDALASNVKDAFSIFAGKSTLPLFEDIKKALDYILHQIIVIDDSGVHLTPTFQKLAYILSVIGGEIGSELLGQIKSAGEGFAQWAKTLDISSDKLKDVGADIVSIGENVGGIVLDLFKFFAELVPIGDKFSDINASTSALATIIGVVRDGLKIVYGIVALIRDVFQAIAIVITGTVYIAIDELNGRLDAAGRKAQKVYDLLKAIFNRDFTTLKEGVTGADIQGQRRTKAELGGDLSGLNNFSAFPRNNPADSKAANDRQKRERISALKALNEAALEVYLQNRRNEVDVANQANDDILKNEERRFNLGLVAAQDFYNKKEKLTLENIQREEGYKQDELEAEKTKLRLNLAALEGQADITDEHFKQLFDRFKSTDRSQLNPADTVFNKQVTEFLKFQKSAGAIQGEINKLADQRKQAQDDLNNSTEDTVRLNKQLAEDIKGQLADAIGAGGVSDAINLSKRISDELPKLLNEFGKGIPGLKEVANVVHDLGDADLSKVIEAFDLFNVDVDSLPEPLRNVINLFKQLRATAELSQSSSRANSFTESLKFDLEGIVTGLDRGQIGLTDAVTQAQERKKTAIDALNAELQNQKAILDSIPQPKTAAELAHYNAVTQAVGGLSRAIDTLKTGTDELSLVTAHSQQAQDVYAAKIEQIKTETENYSITSSEALKLEKQARQELINKLLEELAVTQLLDQTVPDNAKKVADLINQVGTLQNEQSAQTLDLAHGIEDSIGGAFSNFFDAIQQGNQGILDSFRQVVSQMLLEIAKLIFQAYVLKAVMSAINSFIGGFIPSGAGGSSIGASAGGGLLPTGGFGLAEGGIVSGRGTGVSDSIPAMLSHGEAVIPARSVNAYGRGLIQSLISGSFIPMRGFARFAEGGFVGSNQQSAVSGQRGTRIVNIVDKSLMSDYLNSSDGEQVVLNIIGKNRGMLQRLA